MIMALLTCLFHKIYKIAAMRAAKRPLGLPRPPEISGRFLGSPKGHPADRRIFHDIHEIFG